MQSEICCTEQDTGFIEALINNDVLSLSVGHDHKNDFGGELYTASGKSINLQYGRKSGYGGYSPLDIQGRGVTVFTLRKTENGKISIDSEIIEEFGGVIRRNDYTKKDDS